jgi:transcriptional repressor NrdR
MRCPRCQHEDTKVLESRDTTSDGIRRRRECLHCQYRFTTYERIEQPPLTVIKRDGTRQAYNRDKLVAGLQKACEKTTLSNAEFERIITEVEKQIYDSGENEIRSTDIGRIAIDVLADINQIACIRFASVYRSFNDLESFEQELQRIKQRKR